MIGNSLPNYDQYKLASPFEDEEEEPIIVSNCCAVYIFEDTDICSNCREHCAPIDEGEE